MRKYPASTFIYEIPLIYETQLSLFMNKVSTAIIVVYLK